jgi:hypothetical protein
MRVTYFSKNLKESGHFEDRGMDGKKNDGIIRRK